MTALTLSENNLNGSIHALVNLKVLEWLYLNDNNFSGNIPDGFCDMYALYEFSLRGNPYLTGTIPQCIGNTNINHLEIGDTSIYGEIPDSICNLRKLNDLMLSGMELGT